MKSNRKDYFWQIFKLSISDQISLPYKFILVYRLFYENRILWILTIEEKETRILYRMENKKISIHLLFLSFSFVRNFPDALFENTTSYIYIYKILHFRSEFVVPEIYSPVFIDLTRKTKCKVRIFLMRVRLIEE